MTCNDCICSEVCYYKSFNDVRDLKKRRNDVEKICKSFVHRDSLKNAPTIDAVEVVRCKDCLHRKEQTCFNPSAGMWVGVELKDGDFCSYGERKDNERKAD